MMVFCLCVNCGRVTHESEWTYWQRGDDEKGEPEWVPSPDGSTDPMCRCPACGWEHVDDDSNPGYYNGTLSEMIEEREREQETWAEHWQDVQTEQAAR